MSKVRRIVGFALGLGCCAYFGAACSAETEPQTARETPAALVQYPGTVGALAASLVTSASTKLTPSQIKAGVNGASVLSGAQALSLLHGRQELPDVNQLLQREGAIAILLSLADGGKFLFVPIDATTNGTDTGIYLPAGADSQYSCWRTTMWGDYGSCGPCITIHEIVPCPGGSTGTCGQCTGEFDKWTQDDLWTNPKPERYNKAEAIFGEDSRFACKQPVETLHVGSKLFDSCAPAP